MCFFIRGIDWLLWNVVTWKTVPNRSSFTWANRYIIRSKKRHTHTHTHTLTHTHTHTHINCPNVVEVFLLTPLRWLVWVIRLTEERKTSTTLGQLMCVCVCVCVCGVFEMASSKLRHSGSIMINWAQVCKSCLQKKNNLKIYIMFIFL